MEELEKIKDATNNFRVEKCNIIHYVDNTLKEELLKNIIVKINSYNDDNFKSFPVIIDAISFQELSIKLEEYFLGFFKNKNINTTLDVDILKFRKSISKINDLDELRKYKRELYQMEKLNETSDVRISKNWILNDYFNNLIPLKLSENYKEFREYKSNEFYNNINILNKYIESPSFDILDYYDKDRIFHMAEIMYDFIRAVNKKYQKSVPIIINNGERVIDYDLQEVFNSHMWNQRSGIVKCNLLTEDIMYHNYFQQFYLENNHDVERSNFKSKRYYRDINKK